MNLQKILERETEFINQIDAPNIQKMRVIVSMYRLLTFDSHLYTHLHGATAITKKGNAVLFGDGVSCIGKTTASLVVAADSKRYVVDECTLYNHATGSVYGNKNMPVHIRPSLAEHFSKAFNVKLGKMDGEFGTVILPEELGLEVVDNIKLSAIVCPRYNEDECKIVEERDPIIRAKKLSVTVNAHRLKFLDNSLDRANGKSDKGGERIELIDNVNGYMVPAPLMNIKYYDAYCTEPQDVLRLIEEVGL